MVAEITAKTATAFFAGSRPADSPFDRQFEQLMNDRDTVPEPRGASERRPDRRPDTQNRQEENRRTENNRAETRQERPSTVGEQSAEQRESGISAEPVTAEITETPAETTTEAAEEILVDAIAAYLQIPVELVMQVLEELGIQPKDLADQAKANIFLQALLEKAPLQLLNLPEYPQMVKSLTKIAAEIMQQPTPETLAKLSDALTQLGEFKTYVDSTKPNKQLVVEQIAETTEHPKHEQALTTEPANHAAPTSPEEKPATQLSPIVPETEAAPRQPHASQSSQTTATYDEPEILPEAQQEAKPDITAAPALRAAAMQVQPSVATALATPTGADPAQVMEQIMERVKLMPVDNTAEIRLTLRPESLGEVALRIASIDGVVSAMFVAESMRVKEIIESNFNQLRDALQEQGIQVSSLHVSVGGENAEEQLYQQMRAQQEALRRAARIAQVDLEAEAESEAIEAEDAAQKQRNLALEGSTVEFAA